MFLLCFKRSEKLLRSDRRGTCSVDRTSFIASACHHL